MYVLDRRADVNLESSRRVAWEGDPAALTSAACGRIMDGAAKRSALGGCRGDTPVTRFAS